MIVLENMTEQTLIEKYGLEKYINSSNVSQKEPSSISARVHRLGIEDLAFEDFREKQIAYSYPKINLSFLKMKNKNFAYLVNFSDTSAIITGFPQFAIFDLDSPEFKIDFHDLTLANNDCSPYAIFPFRYQYPYFYPKFKSFEDGFNVMSLNSYLRKTNGDLRTVKKISFPHTIQSSIDLSFTTYFKGIIPENTKEKIAIWDELSENSDIYDNTFILVEANDWNAKIAKHSYYVKDPLVIGIHNNQSYLVDIFNATSLEDYVRREFTTSKLDKKGDK